MFTSNRFKKRFYALIVLLCATSLLVSCGSPQSKTPIVEEVKEKKIAPLTKPSIPSNITAPAARNTYLTAHYWDNFDFTDTAYINKPDITEQAFVDFLSILPYVKIDDAENAIGRLFELATQEKLMYQHFIELAEKYLYDPNSPFRNETYYIPVLNAILTTSVLDEVEKSRYKFQHQMALKNRVGEQAIDFEFTLKNNKKMNLYALSNLYTLLFFNNPDCSDCKRVKGLIIESPELNQRGIQVVSIYTDEELEVWRKTEYPSTWINGRRERAFLDKIYDLKAIPTIYLLDSEKRVVLKDATIEYTIEWVRNNVKQYVLQ